MNARVGLFEQAHRSTIFLDEISELPMSLQAKLLRVLQEREIQRIGSSRPVPVDVRVIAASNTNLLEAVANQRFREDLYYRLNVVALQIPALRERATDVPELADYFFSAIADQEGGPAKTLSPEALAALVRYSWPGNVRQLEHALESAVALSGSRTVLYPGDFVLPVRPHRRHLRHRRAGNRNRLRRTDRQHRAALVGTSAGPVRRQQVPGGGSAEDETDHADFQVQSPGSLRVNQAWLRLK